MNEYKIGVIGLGYVGLPLAVEFSCKYPTVGYDIKLYRIKQLRQDIDVTNESYVTAKIYNISGQEVETVHDGMLSAKTHQMRWMADHYASGVYFIKVVVDNKPATHRKIVLLK